MIKKPNSIALFVIITLLITSFIAYLGFRTIEHEALLRHYQTQTLAKSHTEQVGLFITEMLNKKATRLNAIAQFIRLDEDALAKLIAEDSEIDNIFVLQKNILLFPKEQSTTTEIEKKWIQTITPISHDPSQLYSHYFTDDEGRLRSGWFIREDSDEKLLIYWLMSNDSIIGFKISYVHFLSEVINTLNFTFPENSLTVADNTILLYQSGSPEIINRKNLQDTYRLSYPLTNWQVDYYAPETNSYQYFLWGGLFIFLMIAVIGLIAFRLYREYTLTLRLASQQVNFVGQVSHELKTPLTNITLYAEILKEDLSEDDSRSAHYLDVIVSESQRLSRLIQNILSFTKAPKLHIQKTHLNVIAEQVYQTFIPAFEAKGIQLNLVAGNSVEIETDIDRVIQIISNFLNNAEKYAGEGKRVDLNVQHDEHSAYIHVRDYGKGIAAKEIKNIFQPFYRIKSSLTEGVSGTGLGLTIAEQLARSLKGEVKVENTKPGVQFTLVLPLPHNVTGV